MPPKPLNIAGKPATTPAQFATAEPAQPSYMPVAPTAGQALVPAQSYNPPAVQQQGLSPNVTRMPPVPGKAMTMEQISKAGYESQRGVSDLSAKLANAVKLSDMDKLGSLLGDTLSAAKGYDPANNKGSWFGWVKASVEKVRQNYESAENTTNRLVGEIDRTLMTHRQRQGDIDQMQAQNVQYHAALAPEIAGLLENAAYMEANTPAVDASDMMSVQAAQEWTTIIVTARKRADDLTRSRAVTEQMSAQLSGLKQNGGAILQKFDGFKTVTMPILRQAFVMYIMALEQEAAAKMANSIDDLTDATLIENARKLGQTTSAVHNSLARSNISLEAIKAGHDAMVASLDEIDRIRVDMKQRLASEAPQIEQASRDLAARLARPAA